MKHNFIYDRDYPFFDLKLYKCTNCDFIAAKQSYQTVEALDDTNYHYPCSQILMESILK